MGSLLKRRQSRQRAVVALITVVSVLFGALSISLDLFGPLQNFAYDFAITQFPAKVKNQITIVGIDDKTIEAYGHWPLPRKAYADLLGAMKSSDVTKPGPSVVAFDVAFYDNSDAEADQALAAAIKASGNVILAMQGPGDGVQADGAVRYAALTLPIPSLRDAAAGLGAVNIVLDADARARDAQMDILGPNGDRHYTLPLVAALAHLRYQKFTTAEESNLAFSADRTRLMIPGRLPQFDVTMPIDPSGAMAVYYAAPPATDLHSQTSPCKISGEFCVVSLIDVVNGKVPRELLANRIVFVGAHSASALPDSYPVPNSASAKMFGVEIWANVAQSILTDRFPVRREGNLSTLVTLAVVTLAGLLLVARFRLAGFLGALVLLVVYMWVSLFVFFANGTTADRGTGPIAVPSLGYVVPAVFWWIIALGYLLVEEQLSVARTQSTFGRFVTPSVARTIMEMEEAGHLALGGEEKQVTVLFGDIRGFTTMSEGMSPSTLLGHLNQYFDGMVSIVNRFEGTVNKYNGDNIMVIWNAPLEVEDHARKAVTCALEMQRWIVAERAKGGPDVSFGFGVNTGPVVAGFLGAKGRMEYTVIGDTANVASRLTSADIARRDQVACSAATLAGLGPDVVAIELGAIQVKGRAEPVPCYQIDRLDSVDNPNPAPAPEVPIGRAAVGGFH
jgi:adenylate cyclase